MKKIFLLTIMLTVSVTGAALGQEAANSPAAIDASPAAALPDGGEAGDQVATATAVEDERAALERRLAASPMTRMLTAMPDDVRSFIAISDLATVAGGTRVFREKTGLTLPLEPEQLNNVLNRQIGLRGGVSDKNPIALISLDPIAYRGRDKVYLVPVQGREEFMEYNPHEEIEDNLYRLTTIEAPRFFTFTGDYACFSESIRTARDLRDARRGIGHKMTAEQHSAMANSHLYLHLNMARTLAGSKAEVDKFRQATMMRVLGDPVLKAYSDLLIGYMTTINEIVAQADMLDLGLKFHEDEVEFSGFASFVNEGAIRAALKRAGAGKPQLTARLPECGQLISTFSIALEPKIMRSATIGTLGFILQNSPNAKRKLRTETRERLMTAADELLAQMTGQIASMTALADEQSQAAEAKLTIFQVRDITAFVTARDNFFAMVDAAAQELAAPMAFKLQNNQDQYRGIGIDYLRPEFSFADERFAELFRQRIIGHYGPDGYVYRMAVVNDLVIISVGSDIALFKAAIDKALDDKNPKPPAAIAAACDSLPDQAGVMWFGSLPALLANSIHQAGEAAGSSAGVAFTDDDKQIIRTQGLVGLGLTLTDGNLTASGRVGYEQLSAAVKLATRHLPPMTPPDDVTTEPEPTAEPTPEPAAQPGPTAEPEPAAVPQPTAEPETPEPSAEPAASEPENEADEAAPLPLTMPPVAP